MADNITEENLHTPLEHQPEKTSEQITPAENTEAFDPIQETKNMEVHHHAHNPAAPPHKKSWKSYFWEFLMLFLAVFCGFLAEYRLEHKIEKDRAKVYAANLYLELKKDTAGINKTIQDIKILTGKLDSFCLLATEKESRKITNGMLYYYASYTTLISLYASENTAIEQLKGSGNLRLMGNTISQLINVYEKKLNGLEDDYRLTQLEFAKIEELYFKLFDSYAIQILARQGIAQVRDSLNSMPYIRDSVFKMNPPLINKDPALLKEFIGWLDFVSQIYRHHHAVNFLLPLKNIAIELIEALKKEYHLK